MWFQYNEEGGIHTKPFPIGLNSGGWNFSGLERGSFKNISIFISDRFPLLVHIQSPNLFGIAVEILALNFDIGHAIASSVLTATVD